MPASLAAASSSFSLGTASRLTATAGKRAKPRASPRARPAATRAVSTEQETEQSTARAPTGDAKSASQVHISALADGVQIVRCVCQERLKFEVEYGMQRGSTDNSYIVKGADKTALLDLPDKSFASVFAGAIDCGASSEAQAANKAAQDAARRSFPCFMRAKSFPGSRGT